MCNNYCIITFHIGLNLSSISLCVVDFITSNLTDVKLRSYFCKSLQAFLTTLWAPIFSDLLIKQSRQWNINYVKSFLRKGAINRNRGISLF